MKLQIAPSIIEKNEFIKLIKETYDYIDIIEVENIIYYLGAQILKDLKKEFKDKIILADCKTLYFDEIKAMYDNDCDIATMSSVANDEEIKKAINYAHSLNKKIQIDCTEIEDIENRLKELEEMGVDIFALESKIKGQERDFIKLESIERANKVLKKAQIAIQGGVNLENINDILKHKVDIIICGGAIQKAESPQKAAAYLKNLLGQ